MNECATKYNYSQFKWPKASVGDVKGCECNLKRSVAVLCGVDALAWTVIGSLCVSEEIF